MSTNSNLIKDPDAFSKSLAYGIPTSVLLAALGSGLTKKRSGLVKFLGTIGLPAAYLAYLAGKKGNGGLDMWDGSDLINKITYPINDAGWAGLMALSEGLVDNKLGLNNSDRSFLGTGLARIPNNESNRLATVGDRFLAPWLTERKSLRDQLGRKLWKSND